jgi:superkiller protein 3
MVVLLVGCSGRKAVVDRTDTTKPKPVAEDRTVPVVETADTASAAVDTAGIRTSTEAGSEMDPTQLRGRALDLFMAERYDEALPLWLKLSRVADSKAESAAEAHYVLGSIFFQKGEYARAESEYKLSLRADSLMVDAHQDLGLTYFVKGDYDKALRSFRNVLTILPGDSEATYWVNYSLGTKAMEEGLSHFNLEEYDRAVLSLKTALRYLKSDTAVSFKIHYFIGKSHVERFEYDEALVSYLRCVALNPNSAEAYTELGSVYFARMEFDRAIEANRRALEIQPDYPKAHNNLGYLYFSQANSYSVNQQQDKATAYYEMALELFERALTLDPGLEPTRRNMDHVRKILSGDRKVTAYTMLQQARRTDNNRDRIRQYQAILADDSTYDDAYNNLGVAYFFEGHADSAIAILEKALRINPFNPQAHNNLGYILGTAHRYDEALRHLFIAIQIKRDYLDAYVNLGYVYMWKEDFANSRKIWSQLLRLNPSNKHARKGLEEMERRERMIKSGESTTTIEIHDDVGAPNENGHP